MSQLEHYGILRKSGRYPYGSGGNAETSEQRNTSFSGQIREMKASGMKEVDIAKALGMSTTTMRNRLSIERNIEKKEQYNAFIKLKEKGWSNTAIGERYGVNESTVRSVLAPERKRNSDIIDNTKNAIKEAIERDKYIEVGPGTELGLGVTRSRLNNAIQSLEDDGYKVHYVRTPQLNTPDKLLSLKVITKADVSYGEIVKNKGDIKTPTSYSENLGETFKKPKPVTQLDGSRVLIRYGDEGGSQKDGIVELRKGVEDLSLGGKAYAQVRIAVDNKSYMKGMAIYSDDIPDGYDIIYNTNKPKGTPAEKVYKPLNQDDPINPFGAVTRPKNYLDINGNEIQSPINIMGTSPTTGEEGSWSGWSKNLSSQFLSKQSPTLAKQQLDLDYSLKLEEYNDILAVTNPNVRSKLLQTFSDGADAAAVDLKAAALPRQSTNVLLPLNSLKVTEVYAPNYNNGEQLALVRYPHGGIFEIPVLTVNNKNKEGVSLFGQVKDAIAINSKTAEQLSGADFDADFAITIPVNNKTKINSSAPLKELEGFDPKALYKLPDDAPYMTSKTKGKEMGSVSNLITDMTLQGATTSELARAVKHSMVVIDAEKHHLDYQQSARDNGIPALKEKYQGRYNAGASTLISRSSSDIRVGHRKEGALVVDPATGKSKVQYIDPATGQKMYTYTGQSYEKNGKTVERTTKSTKMYETDDAYTLTSGDKSNNDKNTTLMESYYADYANDMKALANTARLELLNTPSITYSPTAKKTYADEVASLDAKLRLSLSNKPLERQAHIVGDVIYKSVKDQNPQMSAADRSKAKAKALNEARQRVGAGKQRIEITPQEWNAIQAGAISSNKLNQILDNTDLEIIRQYATPRTYKTELSTSKQTRLKNMLSSGYTQAEIASALGISTTTVNKYA